MCFRIIIKLFEDLGGHISRKNLAMRFIKLWKANSTRPSEYLEDVMKYIMKATKS